MRRIGLCVVLLAALVSLGGGCASSGPAGSTSTAAAAPASGARPAGTPSVAKLPNGLTLIVQEHRAADVVAVHMWVATGVRYETPDTLGHAHFQEHMLFKGTDTFGPGHIDRTLEGTGGRSNAFTGADYTTYQILVPSEATPTAIELLDAMMFRSAFDPKVGSQAMDRRTNARQVWYLAAAELAGVGYEYFDVYAANVRKVTAADVQRVARKYLGVMRTVVVQPQ